MKNSELSNAIRVLSMDMVEKAQSGHPGLPMGMADVVTVLYQNFISFNPNDPNWHNRDRFILSAGHGSAMLYAILYLTGYKDMSIEDIKMFRQLGSKTAGHPEYGYASGIETTTGPLGQGLANAVGMAIAERMMNARYGDEIYNHKTYVIVGDGCLMEGISQEAISIAGHLKLKNLIILFDDNGISIDGPTYLSTSENHVKRFEANGFNTICIDGHDDDQIYSALEKAQHSDKPVFISCKTIIGKGSPNKAGTSDVHGSPLGADESKSVRKVLNWPYEEFVIPEDVLSAWRNFYKRSIDAYEKNNLSPAPFTDISSNDISLKKKEWNDYLTPEATRKSSEHCINFFSELMPNLIGGSADLTSSNLTKSKTQKHISKDNFSGTYVYWGIREHGMAAMMNGIALYGGFIPYGGTFLVFSDYLKPALRLSAIMKQRVIYVMTHDSIGLGEDGPTHQPIEHLASLRAIPNVVVMRPCDRIETLECWEIALNRKDGPSVIALSRQSLPQLRHEYKEENLSSKGGYVIKEYGSSKDIIIYATGSEVSLAVDVADHLHQQYKKDVTVISMVSLDLFLNQEKEYQSNIRKNTALNVVIEAGSIQGWEGLLGEYGLFFGLNRFGESGKANDLYKHFGLDKDSIITKIISHIS